jgi:hypothetical protein
LLFGLNWVFNHSDAPFFLQVRSFAQNFIFKIGSKFVLFHASNNDVSTNESKVQKKSHGRPASERGMTTLSIPWFVAHRFHGGLKLPIHPFVVEDGTYYFATQSFDKAPNWETGSAGNGDTSIYHTAPSDSPGTWPEDHSGKEGGGGGCFISAAAPEVLSGH